MRQISLDQLSVEQFRGVLHTNFRVSADSGDYVTVELIAVTTQPSAGSQFEAFSLLFKGPVDRSLAQRTYTIAHDSIGMFELFIVPVAADSEGRQYEAVFNRRLTSANV